MHRGSSEGGENQSDNPHGGFSVSIGMTHGSSGERCRKLKRDQEEHEIRCMNLPAGDDD
jgi:hypothetical protein